MTMPQPRNGQRLQRECSECEDEKVQRQPEEEEEEETVSPHAQPSQTPRATPAVTANINALGSGGQPLPETSRAFFEPRFGHDFSRVRVHTDSKAADTAQAVQAKAFTVGRDIVFGAGQYAPDSQGGRRLLAHELAHVVQQEGQTKMGGLRIQRQSEGKKEQHEPICPTPEAVKLDKLSETYKDVETWKYGPKPPSVPEKSIMGLTVGPIGSTSPKFKINTTEKKKDGKSDWYAKPEREEKASAGKCLGVFYLSEGLHKMKETKEIKKPGGSIKVPQYMDVSADMSKQLLKGEQEHCNDSKVAYMISLKEAEDVLERHVYGYEFGPMSTEAKAKQLVQRTIKAKLTHPQLGHDQTKWKNWYCCLLWLSPIIRDTTGMHTTESVYDSDVWAHSSYIIAQETLEKLSKEGISDDVLRKLEDIKNKKYIGLKELKSNLKTAVGEQTVGYKRLIHLIWEHAAKEQVLVEKLQKGPTFSVGELESEIAIAYSNIPKGLRVSC
jgi:hypothetical protein